MPLTITVTGPESSGKSTLAFQLAVMIGGIHVMEYARIYLTQSYGKYSEEDLVKIASGQDKAYRDALETSRLNNLPVVADTDLTVIKIWSEVKYGSVHPAILKMYFEEHFDIYLLCSPDIPWEPDPLRENPDDRERLFQLYEEDLKSRKKNYHIIRGNEEERLQLSLSIISSFANSRP